MYCILMTSREQTHHQETHSNAYKPVCLCKLCDAHGTPTFKTEALRVVSNVQLVRGPVLQNERQIQHYLALLRQ